jgi:hypothetical protein
MSKIDRFDKPYRILPTFDERKGLELFNLASKLDTHELLQYSLINQIPLDYINGEGECLIHEVINIDSRKASEHAKLNVIKFLVQNKVNPDQSNKNNQTPLHLACIQQLSIIIEYLLKIGVDPNFPDNMENTPLHYLLTGLIKTIDTSNEVMDFVPPPKKKNLDSINKIIEIKKLLGAYIQNNEDLPMLKSLENTIDKILKVDKHIVIRQLETNNLILQIASTKSSEDNSAKIKDSILLTKKTISDKIMDLFNKLPNLPNFEIHDKTDTSWSPIPLDDLSLISDGNIKKVIKKDMQIIKEKIIDMEDNFILIPHVDKEYYNDGFARIMHDKLIIPESINKNRATINNNNGDGTRDIIYDHTNVDGDNVLFPPDYFNEINDEVRHWLAMDNASSIIDFENLKYMGGPRSITIINNINLDDYLDRITKGESINKIIFSMLCSSISNNLPNIDENFILLDNLTIFDSTGLFYNEINLKIINPYTIYSNDVCFYLVMAYTAIFNPIRFNEVENIIANGNMLLDYSTNLFALKWFSIYNNKVKSNKDKSSWIYGMQCDIYCKMSDSNLEGFIPVDLFLLVVGLANNKNDILKSIINAYKPHLIHHILTSENYFPLKLAKIIITLMNFDINKDFMDTINNNSTAPDSIDAKNYINTLRITEHLKNLGNLLIDWYNYMNDYIAGSNTSEFDSNNNIYIQYKKSGDYPENVIIKIILSLNEQADNQLLHQTLIDLIYLVKNISTKNKGELEKSINNFEKLSGFKLFPLINPTAFILFQKDIKTNLMPSEYSTLNYDLDLSSKLNSSHLLISHIFGLYYQGLIYATNFTLNQNINISNDYYYLSPHANHHSLQGDSLGPNQLPIILNYLFLNITLTPKSKYTYYNITGKELIIPTHNAYANSLLIKINHYQTEIEKLIKTSNVIIDKMINGTTSDLPKLYLEIYPEIVLYSNILSELIDSFNSLKEHYKKDELFNLLIKNYTSSINNYNYKELAKGLNRINSNYYIYYYLYQPGNLIKLSRFNYYQIPIEFPTKSFYYNGTDDLVNINLDSDPYRANMPEILTFSDIDSMFPISDDHINYTKNPELKMFNEGYINDFRIGNYSNIFETYRSMKLPTSNFTTKNDFVILKESSVPPSLFYALADFYKYTLIEIVKTILTKIKTDKKIWNETYKLIKSTGIAIDQYDLTTYSLIMNLIQELIKEQIEIYINTAIINYYNKFITDKLKSFNIESFILPTKEIKINLTFSSIKLDTITKLKYVKNMFSLVIQPSKPLLEPFILYPNDLTNINKLRSKYGVIVNSNIVETMIKGGASLYASNADGYSTIFPIIKNYNYKLIQTLKNSEMIDFTSFSNSPLNFIHQENINNVDKIVGSFNISENKIKDLLGNIDGYLYNDIKSMITANELFGNNILIYLPESFNMSTYLILQYLSESLDLDFNIDLTNISELIKDFNIDFTKLNENFLDEKFDLLKVPDSIEHIIIEQLIEEKQKELTEFEIKKKEMDEKIKLHHTIKTSNLHINISNNIIELKRYITLLFKLINASTTIGNKTRAVNIEIIESYKKNNEDLKMIGPMIKAWSKLLDTKLEGNYNLIPLYVLIKQKELIGKNSLNPNDIDPLQKIEIVMKHWALIAETYFSKKKYTDDNEMLKFIEELLNYITIMVIGNGIELMMRRILMTWLLDASIDKDYDKINEIINYILETDLTGKIDDDKPTTMLKELYNNVCPNLVKNSAEIFENRSDEQAHNVQNTKEILLNYFQLLDLTVRGKEIPNEVKDIFNVQVVNYFDTIISKSISLWFVNIENILKFFINNYRCLKTMLELIN